jgi:hypothetical protein
VRVQITVVIVNEGGVTYGLEVEREARGQITVQLTTREGQHTVWRQRGREGKRAVVVVIVCEAGVTHWRWRGRSDHGCECQRGR